ncbi:hypothetical protein MMC17_007905 [Xylographa soralifera]|nr:hypothetical protein [Xylographa soralifera]
MSFGRITNSILSGTNENSVSLANLNLDFAIIKVEAPVEFAGIGSALSTRRRDDAEEGTSHKTARKLGALFEQIIPSTPKLITAYGLRVTEIIKRPGVNPEGSQKHGPFRTFVGADGTAMWAAATSGISALGIYLLASLLARAWDAKEACSIWVELVKGRQEDIQDSIKRNCLVSDLSLLAARQEISRHDLAIWDASTRAWLRSADQAMSWEQKQLMLILENINIPFNGGANTYGKVVGAWQQAMIGMENLLCGRPQSISNGSVLLALSAWHLYPDLIVLSNETTNIKFKDPLVPPNGIVTIGLHSTKLIDRKGIQWSLTLSHLRYYGGPVEATTADFSRVSFKQLQLIALGSIFGSWRVGSQDFLLAAQWIHALWCTLTGTHAQEQNNFSSIGFDWLCILVQAARQLIVSEEKGNPESLQLVKFGKRRAKTFLCHSPDMTRPFFGLRNPYVVAGLEEKTDIECGVRYLREIAESARLKAEDAIICYTHKQPDGSPFRCFEYATAIPHRMTSRKRNVDGNPITDMAHARWLIAMHVGFRQSAPAHDSKVVNDCEAGVDLQSRMNELSARGETCAIINTGPYNADGVLVWEDPPTFFNSARTTKCLSGGNKSGFCRCFDENNPGPTPRDDKDRLSLRVPTDTTCFRLLFGSRELGLYYSTESRVPGLSKFSADQGMLLTQKVTKLTGEACSIDPTISRNRLHDYLCCIVEGRKEKEMEAQGVRLIASSYRLQEPMVWSLNALSIASSIYNGLRGATISLILVTEPLESAHWLPRGLSDFHCHPNPCLELNDVESPVLRPKVLEVPSRPQTFACIAMFESGTLNLDPDDLQDTLAMCSDNSIYVAGVVLSDPFQTVASNDVRRIIGNIGHPGICMLIAAKEPKIRPLSENYNVVTHAPYDWKRENNFRGTSLHLSFTDWTLPLETDGMRTIDRDVQLVESIISVMDRGQWVADLDILSVDFASLNRLELTGLCHGSHSDIPAHEYTSLDSWEELLDGPESVGIFRAHGNWAARLAAVTIMVGKGLAHCVAVCSPGKICLKCLEMGYNFAHFAPSEYESPLPSFCID